MMLLPIFARILELPQVRQQGVVRPDTGAQFQLHVRTRLPLVVFSPGACHFEYTRFHSEWCACGH